MKASRPSARRSGRVASLWLFPFFSLLLSLSSAPAYSASLAVKIKQTDRAGAIKSATCKELQKCELQLAIQTAHAKETVTVHVDYIEAGGMRLMFETPKGYLYARDKNPSEQRVQYETIWHTDVGKQKSQNVTLFLPAVPNAILAPFLNTAQEPVADLEITTEATP